MAKQKDFISLGKCKVEDKDGVEHAVSLTIAKEGYIADVFVDFGKEIDSWNVCDDVVVIKGVMKHLKSLGYKGKVFDRAELGMQGKTFITLEPPYEFEGFVIARYGWRFKGEGSPSFVQAWTKINKAIKQYKGAK